MADMRVSMLLDLQARAAIAEAQAFKGAAEAMGKAVRAAGQDGAVGAQGLAQVGNGAQAVEKAVKASATALQSFSVVQDTVAFNAAALISKVGRTSAAWDGNVRALLSAETALQSTVQGHQLLAQSMDLTIAEQLQFQNALDATRAQFDPLFAASKRYEQELRDIADAERMGALSAIGAAAARDRAAQGLAPMANGLNGLGRTAQGASMHVAQLGYQFNDIGMMLAAGQNPLMLAVQQGTQLTQQFEMMRSSGMSVGAGLRQAFLNLLNPMNLVTLGAIAAGAFVVQALMSMGGAVKTVDEAFGDLKTSVGEFSTEAKRGVQDLVREFGTLDTQIVRMQENLTAVAMAAARRDLASSLQSISASTRPSGLSMPEASAAQLMGFSQDGFASALDPKVEAFVSSLQQLDAATGVQNQLVAVQSLEAQLVAASGGIDKMSTAQFDFYKVLLDTEGAVNRIIAAEEQAARQRVDLARATSTENIRMGGATRFDALDPQGASDANLKAARARQSAAEAIAAAERENDLARTKLLFGEQGFMVREKEAEQARAATEAEIRRLGIALQGTEAVRMRAATEDALALAEQSRQAAAAAAASKMKSDLDAEAKIVQLTAQYGAQSLEVAYARAAAERDVYEATLAAQGITGTTADEMMRSWDAARGIAAVNIAAGIGSAASQAQFLAAQLGVSLDHAVALMGLSGRGGQSTTPRAQPLSFGGASLSAEPNFGGATLGFGDLNRLGSGVNLPSSPTSAPKGAGGGGEVQSIRDLIAAQERELEVLRETDPVKQELLQYSEELARATPAEREQLEALIRTRRSEKDALEAVNAAQEEVRSTAKSSFLDLVKGATSFRDALTTVLSKLAEMAASSVFDSLWSPSSTGGSTGGSRAGKGVVGSLLGSIFGFADGGRIGGTGGPREDNQLIWGSSGEFVVNAAATAANLPLLEAINAGAPGDALMSWARGAGLLAFADGGQVGGAAVGAAFPGWLARDLSANGSSGAAASGGVDSRVKCDS